MNRSRTMILRMVLPLMVVTLACSLPSSQKDELPSEDVSPSPKVTSRETDTPILTITQSPVSTSPPVLLTKTPLEPTATPTPIQKGIEIIDQDQVEKFLEGQDIKPTIDIKSEVYLFAGGGGIGNLYCELPESWRLPTIGEYNQGGYCFLGFSSGNGIKISLYTPEGLHIDTVELTRDANKLIASEGRFSQKNTYVEDKILVCEKNNYQFVTNTSCPGSEYSMDEINEEVFDFSLILPPIGYPSGKWKFVVEDSNGITEHTINIQHPNVQNSRILRIMPNTYLNPLEGVDNSFKLGDTFFIVGVGFEPNEKIALGIYYDLDVLREIEGLSYIEYVLHNSMVSQADTEGKFWLPFLVTSKDIPGSYFVIEAPQDLPGNMIIHAGTVRGFTINSTAENPEVTITPSTQNKETWEACPGAMPSRLYIDDLAKVNDHPPLANNVRDKPGTQDTTVIGKIQPGEVVKIKDGPECANGWVWWRVKSMETDLIGWTAEGDKDNYWLVPVR